MYIIYKLTNKVNNKIYIGFSSKSLEDRFKQHCYVANQPKNKSFFIIHKAIKKYGKNNFDKEVIYSSDNKKETLLKEDYYINYYNSLYPNGYNIVKGGGFVPSWKNKKHKNSSKEKISKALTLYYSDPKNRLKHQGENNPNYGHRWSEELKEKMSNIKKEKYKNEANPNSKKIKVIMPDNNILFFNCIKQASEYFNVSYQTIYNIIKNPNNNHPNCKLKNIIIKYI